MITYNKNIQTLDEITIQFPFFKPLEFLNNSYAQEVIKIELKNLIENEVLGYVCGDNDLLRCKLIHVAVTYDVMDLEEACTYFDIIQNRFVNEKKKHSKAFNSFREDIHTKLLPAATIRGLYRFVWCIDSITDQMIPFGWLEKDILILIKRMKKADFDPWSVTEPTAALFIESLGGCGYIMKQIDRNREPFKAYDPRGKA